MLQTLHTLKNGAKFKIMMFFDSQQKQSQSLIEMSQKSLKEICKYAKVQIKWTFAYSHKTSEQQKKIHSTAHLIVHSELAIIYKIVSQAFLYELIKLWDCFLLIINDFAKNQTQSSFEVDSLFCYMSFCQMSCVYFDDWNMEKRLNYAVCQKYLEIVFI